MGLLSTFSAASGRAFGFTRSAIAAATDAFFNRVTLLLPGNGTNGAQNNTFLDSSSNNFTITRNGNTTQGTFSPFSQTGWSGYFNGTTTSGPLVYASYSTTNFDWFTSGQDFTLECWVFPVDLATFSYSDGGNTVPRMTGNNDQNGTSNYWTFGPISDGKVRLHYYNGAVVQVTSTATVTANTWNHIAFTKTSSGITIFVNGTATTATAISGTPQSSATYPLTIGRGNSASINGYVSNYRILKNVTPPYSGTYTVPTAPLTDISGTKILTMQANRFVDSSSVANTMTVTGATVSIQAFSPFAPTAAYSAATNGGSGYFDGTGDYLTLPNDANLDLASGDFTVEAWFYATASSGDRPIVQRFNGNLTIDRSQQQYEIRYNNGTLLIAPMIGTTNYEMSFASVPINQWNHCALVRTGNNFYAYLNGVRNATTRTISGSMNTGTWLTYIGYWAVSGSGSFFNGFISDVRINKGQALYTGATYTVPTAPLTTTSQSATATNVELLTNFTNAGITDATAKNVLETVGNAQISTTQSKFGGSSMYFDGTGDYLIGTKTPLLDLAGDFTIECWLYYTAHGSYGGIVSCANSNTASAPTSGWAFVFYSTTDRLYFETGTGFNLQTTNTIPSGQWNHVAVVRSGSTITHYLNGTANGSGTSTAANFNPASTDKLTVGVDRGLAATITGYIDDLRVTRYARYTANFTPPTAAFALQ